MNVRRLLSVTLTALAAVAVAPATGAAQAPVAPGGSAPAGAAKGAAPRALDPPRLLPGEAAAASVPADRRTWLVGARPGAEGAAQARRFGARRLTPRGAYVVPRRRARAFAAALRARGLLTFSEPDRLASRAQSPGADPLSPPGGWRDQVVEPALQPPPVGARSPLLATVDTPLDTGHPEWAGGRVTRDGAREPFDAHGTAVTAVAAAPLNGVGMTGVWPGMRAVNVPVGLPIPCSERARRVARAVRLGAAVINMSYGSTGLCFAEYIELQFATGADIVLVAAAGNEFTEGNALQYPATLPHVITVSSVDPELRSSFFSNTTGAMDLAAPGEDIVAAVPPAFDDDGTPDGWKPMSGTSFSAPMVAAAAAWVRARRPRLSAGQVGDVLRFSARDLETRGWDPATGYGLLDVGAALRRAAPRRDPLEPNDNIVWVNGSVFGRADPFLHTGQRRERSLLATLDRFKDPADVYRIRLAPRSRVRVEVRPRLGDTDLAVFGPRARTTNSNRDLLRRSTNAGTRVDRVTLRNPSSRARTVYAQAYIDPDVRTLNSSYRLTVRRLRG